MAMGYAQSIVRMDFSHLSEDPVGDPIWIAVKNFKLLTQKELQPRDVPMKEDGVTPVDPMEANKAMHELFAKAIVGWRVYDPTTLKVDPQTGEAMDMEHLPYPPTPELVARLPLAIINKMAEELAAAVDPQPGSETPILRTLLSSPSPSTEEPGPAELCHSNSNTSS